MAEQTPLELPIITLREVVMFPHAVMTFHVGRSASVSAINSAVTEYDKQIFLVAQTSAAIERPGLSDLFVNLVHCPPDAETETGAFRYDHLHLTAPRFPSINSMIAFTTCSSVMSELSR